MLPHSREKDVLRSVERPGGTMLNERDEAGCECKRRSRIAFGEVVERVTDVGEGTLGTRRSSTSSALQEVLSGLVMSDSLARTDRLQRRDEPVLFVGCEGVVGTLNHGLACGQTTKLGRKISTAPFDDGHR